MKRLPLQTLSLVGVAIIAMVAGASYTLRLDPELAFFAHGAEVKAAWVSRVESRSKNKVIIYGGSSCTSTVMAKRLLEKHGIPAVNMGLGAGMGARMLTGYALSVAKPGDVVVAALEPDLLKGDMATPSMGVQFALMMDHAEWIDGPSAIAVRKPSFEEVRELKPGGYHFFTMIGKVLSGRDPYRYSREEFQEDGWQRIAIRMPLTPSGAGEAGLSAEGRTFLEELSIAGAERGLMVLYAMPWFYVDPSVSSEAEDRNRVFLEEIATVLPVLDDGVHGVWTRGEDFADTGFHLVEEAARLRTDRLADALLAWIRESGREGMLLFQPETNEGPDHAGI